VGRKKSSSLIPQPRVILGRTEESAGEYPQEKRLRKEDGRWDDLGFIASIDTLT
jgi:hypothetical protein